MKQPDNNRTPAIAKPLLLTMDFSGEAMMLNDGILDALGRPDQVQIRLNREQKRLLIRPCGMDSSQAVVMPQGDAPQAEIGGRSLLRNIKKLAGWKEDRGRICIGEAVPEYSAVCFDLERSFAVEEATSTSPSMNTEADTSENNATG